MRVCTVVVALICGLAGCNDRKPEPPAAPPPAAKVEPLKAPEPPAPAPPPPAPPAAATNAGGREHPRGWPKEGWSKQVLVDSPELPLCVFPDHATQYKVNFAKDAKKQKISADQPLIIGAYAPRCLHESCDGLPSLQCQATLEGNTIQVHTRFTAYHKDGANCEQDCRVVKAACETPKLPKGEYVVTHGELAAKLKVPSVQASPCLKLQPLAK